MSAVFSYSQAFQPIRERETCMSYRVNKRTKKHGQIYWRLIFESWSNGERSDRHIPVHEYVLHSFSPSMTIDQARERAHSKNAEINLNKHEERTKLRTLDRMNRSRLIESAFLPASDCKQFEEDELVKRFADDEPDSKKFRKILSHWHYVQKMIAKIATDPSLWAEENKRIYNYFKSRRSSPEYMSKLLRILNLWGHFYCRKHGKAFLPVPAPTGHNRQGIRDAYMERDEYLGPSEALTPEMLEKQRGSLTVPGQYEWLAISVWFGLRPQEIDSLKKPKQWKLSSAVCQGVEVKVLMVYQSKLTSLQSEKRWKSIPVVYPEQEVALEYVKSGRFARPLAKTLKRTFPSTRITLYGGRKGFTDLMLERGQALEAVSSWLGHATIERTWRSYKRRDVVSFRPAVKIKVAA
ncbi:MAG: hypothetical protein HY074_03010 [Deltaproteobacteria bacterium]|nr:hypothetical protein [Deltaproteobacteria bacterium]